MSTYSFK